MTRPRKLAPFLAFVLAISLSACGDSKSATSTSSTASTSSTTASSVTSSPPTTSASAAPTSVPPTDSMSHLVAVRVSAQGNGDQVTFEFDKGVPGYSLTNTTSPIEQDASGSPINVNGVKVNKIVFATASDVDFNDGLQTYYNGPKRFTPDSSNLVSEVVQVGDFEGRLGWAVGLKRDATATISTASSPPQITITYQ